jgi:hypothetical protein
MRELSRDAGQLLDRRLVSTFISAMGLFPIGSLVRFDSGGLAVVVKANPEAVRRPVVLVIGGVEGLRADLPRLLDLGKQPTSGACPEIVGMEDASAFGIDVDQCLTADLAAAGDAVPDVDSLA